MAGVGVLGGWWDGVVVVVHVVVLGRGIQGPGPFLGHGPAVAAAVDAVAAVLDDVGGEGHHAGPPADAVPAYFLLVVLLDPGSAAFGDFAQEVFNSLGEFEAGGVDY